MTTPIRTAILTCSRDGRYCTGYVRGLMEARAHPAFAGWAQLGDESDIARARGRLATMALEQMDAAGFLFIDDDMHWGVAHFAAVLEAAALGCAVVGGLYSKRRPEGGLVYNPLPEGEGAEHTQCADLVTVQEVGTGFLWIAREVLERLKPVAHRIEGKAPWWHFFPAGHYAWDYNLRGEYLSEDYAFCRKASAVGYPVWLHRGIRLGHEGKAVFHV